MRASLTARRKEIFGREGRAEFAAQFKLLGQAVESALGLCDTPEKCDEQLSRLTVQLEEREGRFGEFDEFLGDLAKKREELYEAFGARRQTLLDEQVAAEIDRINNRRSQITDEEWKDQRAGLTKRLFNLREQQHALQILVNEPGAVVLAQVKVLGVTKGGAFTPTEDIAGSGRIPDVGVLKPKGNLTLIDSKTQNELLNSLRRRGTGLRPSSPNVVRRMSPSARVLL